MSRWRNLSFGCKFVGIVDETLCGRRPMYPARISRKTKAPRDRGDYILASGEVDRAIGIRLRTRERITDPHGGFNRQVTK